MKDFIGWIGLKERLHYRAHQPPFVSERDLWWVSLGENVGSEVNGKSDRFTRPALIFKKLAHGFFLIVPTTTRPHEGSWYVRVRLAGKDEYVWTARNTVF
jgi:mRNA interferase MazF